MVNIGGGNAALFMSQNIEMLMNKDTGITSANKSSTATNDEWINMRSVHYIKAHPKARTDHGGTRAYGFAAPDAEVSAVVTATEDQMNLIETMSTRNGLGILPLHKWTFRATSSDGKRRSATFTGWMYAVGFAKNDGHQGAFADISFSIQLEKTRPDVDTLDSGITGTFGDDAGDSDGDQDLEAPPPRGQGDADAAVKEE